MSRSVMMLLGLLLPLLATGQVDTSFIFNENTAYGTLDIRIAKSPTNYYYLEEGKTFSFRTENGQRTDSYLHLTAWDSNPYEQGQLREKFPSSDRFIMNYRLLKPANFNPATQYPIVIFLHGIQESGNCVDEQCIHGDRSYDPNVNTPPAPQDADSRLYNNDYNLLHGGRNYLNARNRAGSRLVGDPSLHPRGFPGFALFPQSNNGWSPSEVESALKMLRLMIKKYNIDPNRVYINGLSRGGYGAFEAMKRAPWLFAAGALFSPIHDAGINNLNLGPTIQHIPLWIFQGGQDLAPLPRDTEERIRRFRSAGMSIRYTLYDHLGHATWNEAMEEPDFFQWLLGYSNNRIHTFGGNSTVCQSGSEGLTLTMPPGFLEYEWQRDGARLSGGSSNQLVVTESGKYRGRYKFNNSGQWNAWSEEVSIGIGSPEKASFIQRSTLHLPGLDGNGNAILEAEGDYNHYFWYRYDDRVDFDGDADDSFKIATLEPKHGSGYFSLRVASFGGCEGPPSDEKKIFFLDKSPYSIEPPENVTVEKVSASQINVKWKDVSDKEGGYEIWRRVVEGKWVLAGITAKDANVFEDKGLIPSTNYEYKIRAVSDEGRSQYSPGPMLTAETPRDTEPPGRPPHLEAELVAVNTIHAKWKRASDNSSVREYVLFVNDESITTSDTSYVLRNLSVNTTYNIEVAAVDVGDNVGPKSETVSVSTAMTGLFYTHTTGAWTNLKGIDWSTWEYEGRVADFDLSPKRQEDFFNFCFDGFLLIQSPGVYEFRLTSNDGSRLRLNDTLAVDNDGLHDLVSITGSPRNMAAGPTRITVQFFDHMDIDSLIVEYNGPDTQNEWRRIEREVLRSSGSIEHNFDVALYPNPVVNGMANIIIRNGSGDPVRIAIHNTIGQTMAEFFFEETGRTNFTLENLQLDAGVYIVSVTQGGSVKSRRISFVK